MHPCSESLAYSSETLIWTGPLRYINCQTSQIRINFWSNLKTMIPFPSWRAIGSISRHLVRSTSNASLIKYNDAESPFVNSDAVSGGLGYISTNNSPQRLA